MPFTTLLSSTKIKDRYLGMLLFSVFLGVVSAGQLSCDFCAGAFTVAETFAVSKNVSSIVAALQTGCHHAFNHSAHLLRDCLALAKKAQDLLPFLPEFIASGFYPPSVICAILFGGVCELPCCNDTNAPEQVYITLGEEKHQLRVSWVTLTNSSSVVRYGGSDLALSANGVSFTYTDAGWVGSIHQAFLNVSAFAGQNVFYQVGDGANFSAIFSARVPVFDYPMTFAVVGDLGTGNNGAGTFEHLQELSASSQIDLVLHVGDVSYADGNQETWDAFGREAQVFASRVPYLLTPGNHEIPFNFASFRHRYSMPFAPGAPRQNL